MWSADHITWVFNLFVQYTVPGIALTPSLPPSQINAILLGYHLIWRALTVATNITSAHVSTVTSSQITPYIQDQIEASLSPLKVLLFSSHASCPPAIMKYFPLSKQDKFFLWELPVGCLNSSCSGHALWAWKHLWESLFFSKELALWEGKSKYFQSPRHLAHSKHTIFLLSWVSIFEIKWKEIILVSTMTSLFFLNDVSLCQKCSRLDICKEDKKCLSPWLNPWAKYQISYCLNIDKRCRQGH